MALGGCASPLNANGAGVRIGKGAPEDAKCDELGVVYGTGFGMYSGTESNIESAQNELRNKTAALGGNFVIMDVSTEDGTGVHMSGRAIRCTARPANSEPVAPRSAPVQAAQQTPEQRIRGLDDLRQKGLITDEEYQQRRKEILESL